MKQRLLVFLAMVVSSHLARIYRNGTRLTASRDPIVATRPYLIAETATGC
jgi:hypothetical protein